MRRSLLTALLAVTFPACRPPATLTVSVAASLQEAMAEIAPLFEQAHPGVRVVFNFGGSGSLAQQIENGAPADVFLSAAPQPMDRLASKGFILPDTRRNLLHNELVLIAPTGSAVPNSFQDLAAANVKLIALGDPSSVPAGDYGRQVLQALHLWDAVQPKLALAKDVRQVLTYVETGNADAGIVYSTDAREIRRYSTDARETAKVRIVEAAPPGTHAPVVYPVAVVKDSRDPAAAHAFVAFLAGRDASAVFARHGFSTVAP